MKRLILTLLFCLYFVDCQAAAFTSKAAGNWTSSGQTTWNEAGVPGIGDTVTISHNITVDANTTIGTSDVAGTVVIAIAAGKQLTVAPGVSLSVRGDVTMANSATTATSIIMGAGSAYYFDASVSNVKYKITMGSAYYSNPQCNFKTNGTAGSRVTVASISGNGTTYGYFATTTAWQSATIDAAYTDFTDINSSNNLFFDGDLKQYNSVATQKTLKLINCTFSGCGQFRVQNNTVNNILHVLNNNWSGTRHATNTIMLQGDGTAGSGNLRFENNVVDKIADFQRGWSFDDVFGNVFLGVVSSTDVNGVKQFRNNFIGTAATAYIYSSGGQTSTTPVTIKNNYFYTKESSAVDVHGIQQGTMGSGSAIEYSGNIFENGASNVATYTNEGALIMVTGGTWTGTIKNNIVLKDGGSFGSGRLIASLPASGAENASAMQMAVDNNTGAYVTGPLIKTGEGYIGNSIPGMFSSFKNNLAFGTGAANSMVNRHVNTGFANAGALSNSIIKNNNYWDVATGTNGRGYDGYNMDGSLGSDDIASPVNPVFFDSSRRLKVWDKSLGGPGTEANALAEMAKLNLATFDNKHTVPSLYNFVLEGFAPTDMYLQSTGYSGASIGAVPPIPGGKAMLPAM